jgi:Acetyltransferase (GNAT) domain
MIATATLLARNLRSGEEIPFDTGLGPLQLDPEWVWVAEYEDQIVAVLVGSEAHGMLLLWRMVSVPEAPKTAILVLLRRVMADARDRGLNFYATFLHAEKEERLTAMQNKLAKLMAHTQAGSVARCGVFVVGRTYSCPS